MKTEINLEKEFSEMTVEDQKAKLTEYISIALVTINDKFKEKKILYDFDLMMEDFLKNNIRVEIDNRLNYLKSS